MRLDKLTIKTQEAVQDAVELARSSNHQAIEPEHLTLALLKQDDGVVRPLLQKVGANVEHVASQLEAEIKKFPEVTGAAQPYASNDFNDVLQKSFDEANKLNKQRLTWLNETYTTDANPYIRLAAVFSGS